MNEIDYNALFGLGENEQEVAAPAEETTEVPADAPEAEAAPETEQTEDDNTQESDARDDDNAKYAAARRKAERERDEAVAKAERERDAAAEKARGEARAELDRLFAGCGIDNPFTGGKIGSLADFEAYRRAQNDRAREEFKRGSGLDDAGYRAFVDELPEVKEAREAKEAADKTRQEAEAERARVKMDEQLREIAKLNPEIRELKDLAAMETYPKLYEYVQKGNTILDAYKLANYDALTRSAAESAKQAARNAAQSKQHLTQTTSRGAGAVQVPEDVKAQYRMFNPDATDAEIQAHYARYHKS